MNNHEEEIAVGEQQSWPPAPAQNKISLAPSAKVSPTNAPAIFKGLGLGIAAGVGFTLITTVAGIYSGVLPLRFGPAIFALPPFVELYIARRLCDRRRVMGLTFGWASILLSVLLGGALAIMAIAAAPFSDLG